MKMTSTLENFMNSVINVITGDGRTIIGQLKGSLEQGNKPFEERMEIVVDELSTNKN